MTQHQVSTDDIDPRRKPTKLAVVGAGAVGSALAYASILRGTARQVVLYDTNAAKVRAEALDLAHGLSYAPVSHVDGSDDIQICADADVIAITAGAKQKPGQSRLELAADTIDIMRTLVPQLVDVAPNAIFLMVANPVDVVTYAGLKISGLPREHFFGSGTVLDSSRLRLEVAQVTGVAVQNVHAYIAGEHGDSEVPLWSAASIGAVPLLEWDNTVGGDDLNAEVRDRIAADVVDSAYKVISGKGATNYAIGISATRIIESILRDEGRVMTVSTLIDDFLPDGDVCMSVPTLVSRHGAGLRLMPRVNDVEQERLVASARSIREVASQFGF